ncbi:hypothetical protein CGRA01v4_10502 [Colletotrichum graminicola]|uniref:C2H2-type domain-containing protein n=1 Tax=Colletotrichum graminicola (strain M1.001 / M2 / FGSC 10212) TaxID=645133 RepID=E3QK31_COLGM|nr:uncharacterized protein GLRG_06363 [Colletotrichum graminicola M1.001]EFQ31219.1 hypothetical protein GLRG_06363 [Colletotrichum graminicola M1.001]WDK19215.1 hypothetical protein CGRA01v4_10502 [Colletotrichum graminicola]
MYPTPEELAMSPEDMRVLRELAGRYGSGSVENTLRNLGSNNNSSSNNNTALRPPPQHHQHQHQQQQQRQQQHRDTTERDSTLSTSTFGSNQSAPSLTSSSPWSNSDASLCGSDAASLAGSFYGGQQQQQQSQDAWQGGGDNDIPFLLSPSATPSLSGTEWQDRHISEYLSTPSREKAAAAAAAVRSPPRRKPIECPLCAVYDVRVGFGRKSDFKKHLQNFHNTDCVWACPQRGCRMVLDFEKAFVTHYKIDHGDVHPTPDRARVELCAQVVFACGFLGCKEVFEAADDGGASAAADRYFDHLAGHFDTRSSSSSGGGGAAPSSEWAYYHQVQNLLRQRALKHEWKHALWDKTARNQLRWQPRSSGDLKKLLECRHLADVPRILHAAWTLGQSSFSSPEHPPPAVFPGAATRPLRQRCPLTVGGHNKLHRGSFGQHRPVFHTTLATVPHPPPRSVPDEPDSLAYPHPGTPLALPEHDPWSTDVVLGPRKDELFDDAVFYAGYGGGAAATSALPNPITPCNDVQTLGGLAPRPQQRVAADDRDAFGALLQIPQTSSMRPGSWTHRLRRLSRSAPPVENKARAQPAWI